MTFKVVNGSWDDGTIADKTVTLDGIAADTLTLTADQIPTAGTKPNANYKIGEWGVTPSVSTRITADTTYTYVYTLKNAISSTVTFKVVNGSWGDGTNADKTVTLNGYEGDTLKLSSDQIPGVGTKPASNYKAGSWDTTPSVDTAILGNKTYTYTYAAKNTVTRTVTFKVVNGSWDDGTTADKTVTLTGYEGDSLKLTQSQIPAVGSKPNETYKAGSWDIAPDTTTAITSNKTYTYTYAVDENDERLKLVVSSERARSGEEVVLVLSIANNPGIAFLHLNLEYDSDILNFVDIESANQNFSDWDSEVPFTGVLDLQWSSTRVNVSDNGDILKIKFTVAENALAGDTLVQTLMGKTPENIDDVPFNIDYEEIENYILVNGTVSVYKTIPGDINGDGKVTGKDLLLLKQYLARIPVVLVGNGDVNADGKITGKDLLLLKQYLARIPVVLH